MSIFSLGFLVATGLVAAGLVSSLWASVTGEPLRLAVLEELDGLMPLRVFALVLSLPLLLSHVAARQLDRGGPGVLVSGLALSAAACWCLIQGVVIVAGIMRFAAAVG